MTGVGGDTGRGVRVAARSVRTWRRIADLVAIVVLLSALIGGIWKTQTAAPAYEWHLMGVYTLAEFLLAAGFHPDKDKRMRSEAGEVHVSTIGRIAEFERFHRIRDRIIGDVLDAALLGGAIGGIVVIGALVALRTMGRGLRRGRRLRGGELVGARELARRSMTLLRAVLLLRRQPEAEPYDIAGIPWPDGAETRHTIVSGTTGSGKTVLIADLVEQIRARGERCVVYDKMGTYAETFFDSTRDVLLNPLDARAPRWSPFLEARTARDFDTMAAALIPRQKDAADPFWITAARQLFSHGAAVIWKRGETRNRVLVDHLLKTELSALAEAMEGTVAQSIVDPANPKTALSVRAMLTANIGAMDLLADEGEPFSVRKWIEGEGKGFLFLTSRGDQHASLRGLISTWLEIAVNALLSLPREDGRRIWVILDELPTLHLLPSLRPGLAESRQFGGCFVLGVQVFSALRDLYGRDGAETISGLCGTRVVLAATDRDTAEWSAESLGRAEVESLSEGVSYDTPRDGVTLSARRDLRSLVLPAEVSRLENLSGYVKFPGAWPVARIRLKYTARPAVAERFVPRAEDERGEETHRNTAAGAVVGHAAAAAEPRHSDGPAIPDMTGKEVDASAEPAREGVTEGEELEGWETPACAVDGRFPAHMGEEAWQEPDWLFEGLGSDAGQPDGRPEGPEGESAGAAATTGPSNANETPVAGGPQAVEARDDTEAAQAETVACDAGPIDPVDRDEEPGKKASRVSSGAGPDPQNDNGSSEPAAMSRTRRPGMIEL